MDVKCLDTYALMEIYLGNKKFLKYLNSDFVLPDLILAEFYGVILREYGEDEANLCFDKFERYCVSTSKDLLREVVKFRHNHKRKGISFFDAVGYIFSLKKGCKFVTGDKEFGRFKNVEFVKR